MQKFVLEFGINSLGSVLCKRNGVVLIGRIAKEVSRKIVREFEKHSQNSLSWEKKFFLCYRRIENIPNIHRNMWRMADSRRQTRSTRRRGPQTDAQFWSNQPDPLLLKRGQADAIRLVRSSVNPAPGTTTASGPMEANVTNASGVPQMVFVDDKDLEEQFLTEDEDTANVLDTSSKPCNNTSGHNSDKPKYPTEDATQRA